MRTSEPPDTLRVNVPRGSRLTNPTPRNGTSAKAKAVGLGHGRPAHSPSGHAVHIGALASAATVLPTAQRNAAWAIGGGLVLTRIALLAHWASDVVAGLAVGAITERLLRLLTGFGRR